MELVFKAGRDNTLIPTNTAPRAFKDKHGNDLSGDDLLRAFGKVIAKHDKKGIPVRIPDQKFVSWLRQANEMLSAGKTSDEIFQNTIVG